MLKRKPPAQLELFVAGPLEQLVPCDHVLARIDRVLDPGWLHEEVADCYCADNGRPGIDPEVAVRLMLAGFLLGIAHDRRLMREAQADIAIRRFIGCGLHDRLPDHSSLTRIRQRWGEDRFRTIFQRTVSACLEAGIAKGEVVHVDATLIRADVSWKSMVDRHAEVVAAENGDAAAEAGAADGESETKSESTTSVAADGERRKADARPAGKRKKVSLTDGDASLAASRRGQRPEPSFKQHTAVDDENGVVLDVTVTTGEVCEGDMIESQVDEVRAATGREIGTAAADSGYAFAKVYGGLERRGIVRRLKDVNAEIKDVRNRSREVLDRIKEAEGGRAVEILESVPGIGAAVLAVIVSEAFDSVRKADLQALRCYFGVAPVTKRSGRTIVVQRRLAANRRLVNAAYHWAMAAIQRDAASRAKYHALRSRGHSHARALRSVADRFLNVVCKMIETGQTFDPERRSKAALLNQKKNA